MATQGSSSGFSSTPSTGQGFASTSSGYADMSGIVPPGWPTFGDSMAAGSTLSEKEGPQLGAPGTPSEQTNGVDATHGTSPGLDVPPVADYTNDVG